MARSVIVLAALASLAFPRGAGSAEPEPRSTVLEATVRFGRPSDPAPLGKVALDGDLLAGEGFAAFNPLAQGLRIALGPVVLLDGTLPEVGVRFRDRGSKGWVLSLRRPFSGRGRLTLRMAPWSGRFDLRASGFPAGALRDAGPAGVAVEFRAASNGGSDVIDFSTRGTRKWSYRRPAQVRPHPGGGGGGGPPAPVPNPGFQTIAEGFNSNIASFRFEVVRDQAAWQTLWTAHGAAGAPPAVDFSVEMVVAVFLGTRSTGGYSVHITSITPATVIGAPCTDTWCPPTGAMVGILEDQPGWNPVTAAVTTPFHIVRTARLDGPILYEMATRTQ